MSKINLFMSGGASAGTGGYYRWGNGPKFEFTSYKDRVEAEQKAREWAEKELAHREKLAGRQLTEREHQTGELSGRKDSRSSVQRMLDREWKPTPPPKEGGLLAELEADAAKRNDSIPLARTDKARAQRLVEFERRRQANLQPEPEPRPEPPELAKLRQLREDLRWHPGIDEAEYQLVLRAIQQYETYPEAGSELYSEVMKQRDERTAARREFISTRTAELQSEIGSLKDSDAFYHAPPTPENVDPQLAVDPETTLTAD